MLNHRNVHKRAEGYSSALLLKMTTTAYLGVLQGRPALRSLPRWGWVRLRGRTLQLELSLWWSRLTSGHESCVNTHRSSQISNPADICPHFFKTSCVNTRDTLNMFHCSLQTVPSLRFYFSTVRTKKCLSTWVIKVRWGCRSSWGGVAHSRSQQGHTLLIGNPGL